MKKSKILILLCAFGAGLPILSATTLWNIPSPMMQGGMIHIDVVFTDAATDTFSSSLEPGGPPQLQPLSLWSPDNDFDPLAPWYAALDPTQQARAFGSRWGFRIVTEDSDPLPGGTSIGIRMLNATTGLESYFYSAAGPGTFAPVFLSSATHDFVLWNGTMWHPVFTMPANTPINTVVSAEFQFFLADATSGFVDYTNSTAGAVPGYSTFNQTITWVTIPEPSAAWLLLAAGLAGLVRRRAGK